MDIVNLDNMHRIWIYLLFEQAPFSMYCLRSRKQEDNRICYMVCSALFLQIAIYRCIVQIQYTLKSQYLGSPPALCLTLWIIIFDIRGNKIRRVLLQQLHTITIDINTAKHQCSSTSTWRNRVMSECRSVDFNTILGPSTCTRVVCISIVTSWSLMGLWRHWWRRPTSHFVLFS